MILRRFIQHTKDQNWFAVGLDVCVVIVGIFLGIQMSEWNQARIEKNEEKQYLTSLASDLSMLQTQSDLRAKYFQVALDDTSTVLAFINDESEGQISARRLVAAFYIGTVVYPYDVPDGAYTELLSTGNLGLISDRSIRLDLDKFYSDMGSMSSGWNLEVDNHYKEWVRSVIPVPVQNSIAASCELATGHDFELVTDCEADISEAQAQEILAELVSQPQIARLATYSQSRVNIAVRLLNVSIQQAESLQLKIEEAIKTI